MFTSKVARQQTKAATDSANKPALQRSAFASRSFGGGSVHWELSKIPIFPPVQTKLVVGPANDPLEHEADRVADQVMRMPGTAPSTAAVLPQISRKCSTCDEQEKKTLQAKPAGTAGQVSGAPPIVYEVLRSPGQPLDTGTRNFFEPRFDRDLSQVRVHLDERASKSAQAVRARAYTVGTDIVFGAGEWAPGTDGGRSLIAHELAHVLQQSGSPAHESQLQRYSHKDCTEDFLKNHVWPSDYLARQMLAKAIGMLKASPSDPTVIALLRDYFKDPSANVTTILGVFNKVNTAFTANDYTYECEDDCDPSDGDAYTRPYMPWGRIHLCSNLLASRSNEYIAEVILHEFTHKYAKTGDPLYCNKGCAAECCPCGPGLSAADALDNADSYACFADRLYLMPPAPSPAPGP